MEIKYNLKYILTDKYWMSLKSRTHTDSDRIINANNQANSVSLQNKMLII